MGAQRELSTVPLLTLWLSEILDGWQQHAGVGDEVGEVTFARVVPGVALLYAAQGDQIIVLGSGKDGNGFEMGREGCK